MARRRRERCAGWCQQRCLLLIDIPEAYNWKHFIEASIARVCKSDARLAGRRRAGACLPARRLRPRRHWRARFSLLDECRRSQIDAAAAAASQVLGCSRATRVGQRRRRPTRRVARGNTMCVEASSTASPNIGSASRGRQSVKAARQVGEQRGRKCARPGARLSASGDD